MQTFRMFLIGLLVALAGVLPVVTAVTVASDSRPAVTRIAEEPTPTPRPPNGQCHGGGC